MRSSRPPKEKVTTENPEQADRFDRVLSDTVQAIEESGIRYVFIGGIASSGLGRPRSTHDIDLFVRPEDAEIAMRALAKHGFKTERTDPSWLYKGFKENILVDIIFRSKGEIYFDQEMYQKMTVAEFHGKRLRLVGPEDLLIIKAVAHSELTPGHWHDAIGILTHANLDWEYLLKRARRAPRRILSLLLYAQSNDIWVPNEVIDQLYFVIFGRVPEKMHEKLVKKPPGKSPEKLPEKIYDKLYDKLYEAKNPPLAHRADEKHAMPRTLPLSVVRKIEAYPGATLQYDLAHLRERIAEDSKTHELDVQVEREGSTILLKGAVTVAERRKAVEEIARETFPGFAIENQIQVVECSEPTATEEMR